MKPGFWRSSVKRIAAWAAPFQRPAPELPPVFIVGCGHSGTSILLRIMGAHSRIQAIRQESSLATAAKPLEMMREFDAEACRHGKFRWIEKTPTHIHHIETLLSLRAGALILLVIRDGRDVAWSIKEREGDISQGIERWIRDNEAGEPFWTHPRVHVLRYEDLVEQPELTVSRATAFLGESFEAAMLDYHEEPRSFYSDNPDQPPGRSGKFHRQFRNWQINQPLFDGRKRWLLLTGAEKQVIQEKAGAMLLRYGYGNESEW